MIEKVSFLYYNCLLITRGKNPIFGLKTLFDIDIGLGWNTKTKEKGFYRVGIWIERGMHGCLKRLS